MKEADLSQPLQRYLQDQGYKVNCEVGHCDMTAMKGDELIVIELKLKVSLKFIYQAINRKQISDSVYLALPVHGSGTMPPEFRNLKALLKRLELGLLLVRFLKTKTRVEVVMHPDQWQAPKRVKRKRQILREIEARPTEYNKAGMVGSEQKITAYRRRVIEVAREMGDGKLWSPAQLKNKGCHSDCGNMLRMNHYGWFVREERGKYRLDESGREALKQYADIKTDLQS
ncbi:MAG: DUF2161 family putative PD-(D/E)XK-type phosphodiesterase [Opitutales bacterium]|nr:DUF2161 family putative PD-(D/E)XK-type phosphodiesterase [Opitutales bacterium]